MLYNEDCLVTMSRMQDESVDLVFADYPFNIQDGKKDYVQFIADTAKEFFRILKTGGNLLIVNNPSNHFKTLHCFADFTMRNKVALLRKGAFFPAYHFGFAHNDAYFLVKGKDMKRRWNGNKIPHAKFDKDFIEYQNGNRTKAGWHPQAMPQALVTKWVGYLSDEGDTVYDPFTGSGTTWVACGTSRHFVGSEFSPKYYEIAVRNYATSMKAHTNNAVPLPLFVDETSTPDVVYTPATISSDVELSEKADAMKLPYITTTHTTRGKDESI